VRAEYNAKFDEEDLKLSAIYNIKFAQVLK
jgi:hypothetical protein